MLIFFYVIFFIYYLDFSSLTEYYHLFSLILELIIFSYILLLSSFVHIDEGKFGGMWLPHRGEITIDLQHFLLDLIGLGKRRTLGVHFQIVAH